MRDYREETNEPIGPEGMAKAFRWVAIKGYTILLHGIGSLYNSNYVLVGIHGLR